MRLFERAMGPCVPLVRHETPDGQGGFTVTWDEGEPFMAAAVLSSTSEGQQAGSARAANQYTVTADRALCHGEVFRRASDGQCFFVESDADDMAAPSSASFAFMQCDAREWEVPDA